MGEVTHTPKCQRDSLVPLRLLVHSVSHAPYSPLSIPAWECDRIELVPPATSWHPPNKCYWPCSTNDGPGAHVCHRNSETTLFAINKFLDECDYSALIPISGVMDEVPKFQDTWRALELAVGSEWLLLQESP